MIISLVFFFHIIGPKNISILGILSIGIGKKKHPVMINYNKITSNTAFSWKMPKRRKNLKRGKLSKMTLLIKLPTI